MRTIKGKQIPDHKIRTFNGQDYIKTRFTKTDWLATIGIGWWRTKYSEEKHRFRGSSHHIQVICLLITITTILSPISQHQGVKERFKAKRKKEAQHE